MKKTILCLWLSACLMLTGCGFLNREYSSIQPHSAAYYESEDSSALRAEGYQDLVNDLLLIISSGAEEGTIRLYPTDETMDVDASMEQACHETQFETPLGAYAVEYITYTLEEDAGKAKTAHVTIDYRRSMEQMNAIIRASSISALHDLLVGAVQGGMKELVLQVGYFHAQQQEVSDIIRSVRQEEGVSGEEWETNYYPNETDAGIIEIILQP